ncbi:DUF2946 domain-containing protein [Xenorhabdus cabanillasii]|uniref:DUF2946 domain-containing protein n=1 Tax=Xenorhabdus cabanillasii TaxID=351673 RepID=UPI002B411388|nr:DUF2946 domain-containing protein [Xenorhabdus sp. Flor]
MLSLFHLSQRRTPALIALLAIMMLFIAPVVSKTLEHSRGIKSEACHGISMPDMQNSNHHKAFFLSDSMNHHGVDHIHMGLMDDIACGYCQLLINLPLLSGTFVPFLLLTLTISRAPPVPCFSGPTIRLFYGESQPRAPPLN